jgi:hypothetical protein
MVSAKIDVRPTLAGKLLMLLFKPPLLNISYFFPNGDKQLFRYIAGMGSSGFVVKPVIQSTAGFVALTHPNSANHFAGHQPVSLSISADHGGRVVMVLGASRILGGVGPISIRPRGGSRTSEPDLD